MAIKGNLIPLNIAKLAPVADWEASAEFHRRSKIEFASRNLNKTPIANTNIKNWAIQIYSVEDKTKKPLAMLSSISKDSSDSEEDEIISSKHYEYLIFLFQGSIENDPPVFVLATSKAYKQIRSDCLMQFPRLCSKRLAYLFGRIQQIATSQLFGPISESELVIQQSFPETVNQSGLVCREFTAVGTGIKVKFKENGVLIYKNFSLEQYVNIVEDLALQDETIPIFTWDIPGLPENNLEQVNNITQKQLEWLTCRYLAGFSSEGWTFNMRLSERWYSKAMSLRILQERRRYGYASGGVTESHYIDLPALTLPMDFEVFKRVLQSQVAGYAIDTEQDAHKELLLSFIANRNISIQYLSTSGNWYGNYLMDCIDGWVSTNTGDVHFKLGTLWYQIKRDYVNLVRDSFNRVVFSPGVVLSNQDAGYLMMPWQDVKESETTYNRSYMRLNQEFHPTKWFDGNQKFRSHVELFDILQISDENKVFIYHVKKSFDTHIKEAVSQLVISAQMIFNTKNATYNHLDSVETWEYCKRVGGERNALQLFQALKTGSLNFVLAFRSNGEKWMRASSLLAMREVVRAKEEIEKLGFTFKISPIPC